MKSEVCLQTMATFLILVACIIACEGAARIPFRPPLFTDDNSLSPVAKYGGGGMPVYQARDWVRIKYSSPRLSRVAPGNRIELECEASGSPPPSVQWLHNGEPVTQGLDENNSIGELRLGSMRARMVVDCATLHHQGSYTCSATAGMETALSTPTLLLVQGNNITSLMTPCPRQPSASPRIVTWSPNIMETIGNDVTLPCVARGTPDPQVYWVSAQDNLITATSTDDRIKVLDSGDLLISSVRWSDMGQYACVAESPLGRDTVTTFLYPMSKDR